MRKHCYSNGVFSIYVKFTQMENSRAITVKSEQARVWKNLMFYKRVLVHTKKQSTRVYKHSIR